MKITEFVNSSTRASVIALAIAVTWIPSIGFTQARLIDFDGRLLDPYLFEGQSSGRSLEVAQQVRTGRASLEIRGLGDLDRSEGRSSSAQGLVVKNEIGSRVEFIEMRARLNRVRLRACATNTSTPRAQLRIMGNFFADGVDPGGSATDNTDKVLSYIALQSEPEDVDQGQYRAVYYSALCADSRCNNAEEIAYGESEPFALGTWVRLSIANDLDNRQLTFRVNSQSESFDYAAVAPSPVPILEPRIRLHLDAKVPNCEIDTSRRPLVQSAGEIDWVRINESAFN